MARRSFLVQTGGREEPVPIRPWVGNVSSPHAFETLLNLQPKRHHPDCCIDFELSDDIGGAVSSREGEKVMGTGKWE